MSSPQTIESRRNPWTHVLVACCTVFIMTVFLMVAAAFNRQAVGLARFFDRHGMLILGVEVGTILALAVIVMAVERKETRRKIEERERALLEERPNRERESGGTALRRAQSSRGPKSARGGPVAPEDEPPGPPGEELP
ncbi:MAG TPA: hypothetical protein VHX68_12090 [Planctomycetaceae bacterium]|nr:hypothetical protein [Planctomycetaceae bacterium]